MLIIRGMSVSAVNTLMTAASVAVQALDYATAINKALAAQALLAALPDTEIAGRQGSKMEWRPQSIQDFIDSARQSRTGATGIQRTKLQYARTSAPT